MRCGFRRTEIDFGPRGGMKSKTWRCSRTAKHNFQDTNSDGMDIGTVCLCTQHLKIAKLRRKGKNYAKKH